MNLHNSIQQLSAIAHIIKKRWDIFIVNFNLKDIFQELGILIYCWPYNLKDMMGSNNILNNKIIYRKLTLKSPKFCQLCNIKNNLFCKQFKSINLFSSFIAKRFEKLSRIKLKKQKS